MKNPNKESPLEKLRIYEHEKQKIYATAQSPEEYDQRIQKLVEDLKL